MKFQIARTYLQQERFEDALSLLKSFGTKNPTGQRAGPVGGARAIRADGRGLEAEEAYRQSLKNADKPSLDSLNRMWRLTFDCGMYERAGALMDTLIGRSDRWLRRTRFIRAWQAYRGGDYLRAIEQLQALSAKSRSPAKYMYWQARSYSQLGHESQARSIYQDIIQQFPQSYYGYQSRSRLREFQDQDPSLLSPYTLPTPDASLGLMSFVLDPWSLGQVLFPSTLSRRIHQAGDSAPPALAGVYLRPLVLSYGKAFPALQEAHEFSALGEPTLAKFALRRVSDELRAFKKASRRVKKRWRFARTPFVDNRRGSNRGAWGIQGRAREKEQSAADSFAQSTVTRNRFLSMAFFALGDFYYGRRHSRKPKGSQFDKALYERLRMKWRYPRSFRPLVEENAIRFGLEPELIWAFITVESAHNPRAISRAGARGLLQVMPHTGDLSARAMHGTFWGFTPL